MSSSSFISYLTAVAAIVSCVASVAGVVLTGYLTKYTTTAAHDLEFEKLFFHSRAEAYHAFLRSVSDYQTDSSVEHLLNLETACTYALLFSSSETQDILSAYGKSLVEYESGPRTESDTRKLVQAQAVAMHAMQAELSSTAHSAQPNRRQKG